MQLKIQVWSFTWNDAGGLGMKLFLTRAAFQAYLYNQIADCESAAIQELLARDAVEEAFRLWAAEYDDPAHRYHLEVHEFDYQFGAEA